MSHKIKNRFHKGEIIFISHETKHPNELNNFFTPTSELDEFSNIFSNQNRELPIYTDTQNKKRCFGLKIGHSCQ